MIKFGTDGWRAIIGDEFTFENVRRVAQAFADYLKGTKKGVGSRFLSLKNLQSEKTTPDPFFLHPIYIGFDRRFRSDDFAREIAAVLAANGLEVYLADRFCPTPVISWTVKKRKGVAGVVVTASHNPYRWNGIKFKEPNGGAALPETTAAVERYLENPPPPHPSTVSRGEGGGWKTFDPSRVYIAALRRKIDLSAIRRAKLKILYDPMRGAGAGYFTKLLGPQVTEIHAESDPTFGGIQPEPIEANLVELKKRMRRGRFDAGLATDGDADRIAAFDEKGNYVDAHHIFALVLQYLVEVEKRRGDIVKTVTATHMVDRLARLYNLPIHETPVGFKHICGKFLELMESGGPLIGGEESGGIGVCHHLLERDGIFVGLLLLEIVAHAKKPLSQIVRDLRRKIGPLVYRRVDIEIPRERIERMMARLAKNGLDRIGGLKVQRIDRKDGCKFYLEGDTWLLVRPSGTEPLLRTYAEAPSLPHVIRLLNQMKALIQ